MTDEPKGQPGAELAAEMAKWERQKPMIVEAADALGLVVDPANEEHWYIDEDGDIRARLGRWRVIEKDEEHGRYVDDEGELTACVVGAPEYHNERVAFIFKNDDHEVGDEIDGPLASLEALDA